MSVEESMYQKMARRIETLEAQKSNTEYCFRELKKINEKLEQELAECKAMMGLKDEVIENYAKAVQAHRRELAEAKEVLSLAKSWTAVQKWDVKGNEEGWNYFVNQLDAAIKESSK